jgi:GDP-4-dehydro-6-deoxy-D-mannose reductase
MPVWLLTGATGFVGRQVLWALSHAAGAAANRDDKLVVLGRRCPAGWPEAAFAEVDLNDAIETRAAIERIAPDVVIHTAGRMPPAPDDELYRINFWATLHLLSALRSLRKPVRVVLSGSAAELGPVAPAHLPVNESYACDPVDSYGRSKWLATKGGLSECLPVEVIVARVFNPIGPGAPAGQALGRFASRLAERGQDPVELAVGDLDSRRDFIDVRDVARAMVELARGGRPGLVYHVGTGRSHRVGDGLDRLAQLSGRSVRLSSDPVLFDRRGPSDSRADIGRITTHTSWRPQISWEKSLEDLWHAALELQPARSSGRIAAA